MHKIKDYNKQPELVAYSKFDYTTRGSCVFVRSGIFGSEVGRLGLVERRTPEYGKFVHNEKLFDTLQYWPV